MKISGHHLICLLAGVLALVLFSTEREAWAESIEAKDIKVALKKNGCQAIPFSGLRTTCKSHYKGVHPKDSCKAGACNAYNTLDKKLKAAKNCVNARKNTMSAFANAVKELKKLKPKKIPSGATSKDIDKLIKVLTSENKTHNDEVKKAEKVLANCQKIRRKKP